VYSIPLLQQTGTPCVCAGCGVRGAGFKKCSRCMVALYCGAPCQHSHWKQHKAGCKEREAAAKNAALLSSVTNEEELLRAAEQMR
jgi:sulfatase maturation enzyme AslB (radical SAM superfamily)